MEPDNINEAQLTADAPKPPRKTNPVPFLAIAALIVGAAVFAIVFNFQHENDNASTGTSTTQSSSSDTVAEEKTDTETEEEAENYDANTTLFSKAGSYNIQGTTHGSFTVDTDGDVTLTFSNATIKSTGGPAIYIKSANTVSIVFRGENTFTTATSETLDGAIYSKADLTISGDGHLIVKSDQSAIVSEKTITINDGIYDMDVQGDGINSDTDVTINAGNFSIVSLDDAIHADGKLEINGGKFDITAVEGLEATYVKINDGNIDLSATDDGINASDKSDAYAITIEINGGNITINMGEGDTDAIDSNGDLYINGGTLDITARSPFDYDGTAKYTNGTIIVNGVTTNAISNQMMGGRR